MTARRFSGPRPWAATRSIRRRAPSAALGRQRASRPTRRFAPAAPTSNSSTIQGRTSPRSCSSPTATPRSGSSASRKLCASTATTSVCSATPRARRSAATPGARRRTPGVRRQTRPSRAAWRASAVLRSRKTPPIVQKVVRTKRRPRFKSMPIGLLRNS
ncbi:hypothetical protein M885DRAFT_205481 [Pelagophyceae sp. CCMP2097]|nr:hypothetical protein M885DRAFT_205481 [Pelagophyceae sp. CCMP2097]